MESGGRLPDDWTRLINEMFISRGPKVRPNFTHSISFQFPGNCFNEQQIVGPSRNSFGKSTTSRPAKATALVPTSRAHIKGRWLLIKCRAGTFKRAAFILAKTRLSTNVRVRRVASGRSESFQSPMIAQRGARSRENSASAPSGAENWPVRGALESKVAICGR